MRLEKLCADAFSCASRLSLGVDYFTARTAAPWLPPQLEAIVRHVVESHGGVTSKLEPGGVQPERSLGILLETPEALTVFGEEGIFEMQDLLTEQHGTNLRNEVAHGLLGDSQLFGTDVLYVWWLLLRYCVLTSKMVERQEQELTSEKNIPPETS